jgi:hypothetical protein
MDLLPWLQVRGCYRNTDVSKPENWPFRHYLWEGTMSDRALLFLASLIIVVGSIGVAIWLIASGQTGTFDGNFLLLSALVIATAFGLYLKFMIKRAMEAAAAPKPKPAPAAQKKAPVETPELVGRA